MAVGLAARLTVRLAMGALREPHCVRATLRRRTRDLANTANDICTTLQRLAEETKNRRHGST